MSTAGMMGTTKGMVREVSGDEFDGAIAGPGPVVVDFWAEWCQPCHALAPVLESLAGAEFAELGLRVLKVDADAEPELASRFGVRGLPTLVVLSPSGEVLGSRSGAGPRSVVLSWVRSVVGGTGDA